MCELLHSFAKSRSHHCDCATHFFTITFLFTYHMSGFNLGPLFLHWPHLLWKTNLTYAIPSDLLKWIITLEVYFPPNIHLIKERSRTIKAPVIVTGATLLANAGRCLTGIPITHFALSVSERNTCFSTASGKDVQRAVRERLANIKTTTWDIIALNECVWLVRLL